MDKEIRIDIESPVVISTEEYRELITAQAYLNTIMEAGEITSLYTVEKAAEIVRRLLRPVRTASAADPEKCEGERSC